jgi:hypothetical protein
MSDLLVCLEYQFQAAPGNVTEDVAGKGKDEARSWRTLSYGGVRIVGHWKRPLRRDRHLRVFSPQTSLLDQCGKWNWKWVGKSLKAAETLKQVVRHSARVKWQGGWKVMVVESIGVAAGDRERSAWTPKKMVQPLAKTGRKTLPHYCRFSESNLSF